MHDRHNAMTIARWPSASGAKNYTYNIIGKSEGQNDTTKCPRISGKV